MIDQNEFSAFLIFCQAYLKQDDSGGKSGWRTQIAFFLLQSNNFFLTQCRKQVLYLYCISYTDPGISMIFAYLNKYWIFVHKSFRDSVPLTMIVDDPGLGWVLTKAYSVHLFAQVAVTACARSLLFGWCTIKQRIHMMLITLWVFCWYVLSFADSAVITERHFWMTEFFYWFISFEKSTECVDMAARH